MMTSLQFCFDLLQKPGQIQQNVFEEGCHLPDLQSSQKDLENIQFNFLLLDAFFSHSFATHFSCFHLAVTILLFWWMFRPKPGLFYFTNMYVNGFKGPTLKYWYVPHLFPKMQKN